MPSPQLATHTLVPSNARPYGPPPNGLKPTGTVLITAPLEASTSDTVPLPSFATHTLVPSKQPPLGVVPTGYVPTTVASAALSFTTFPLSTVTHTYCPSKATSVGVPPPRRTVSSMPPSRARSFVMAPDVRVTQMLRPS